MGRGSIFEDQLLIKTPFTISNDILFVINDVVNVKKHFKTTHQNNLKVEISFITIKTITSSKMTIHLMKKFIAA